MRVVEVNIGTQGGTEPLIARMLPDGNQYYAVKQPAGFYRRWIVTPEGEAIEVFLDN
jgi:hypothetical protein